LIARLVYPSDWQFVRNGGLEHDQPAVLYATFPTPTSAAPLKASARGAYPLRAARRLQGTCSAA